MNPVRFKPLYQQVEESILERIYAGEWPPGTFLPNEFALADQYGVSQGTLRKALEALTSAKHLVRFQGKGTQVADIDHENSIFPFYHICDMENKRLFPTTQTLHYESIPCPEEVAILLNLKKQEEVIYAKRLRLLEEKSDEVVLVEDIYIPKKFFSKEELQKMTVFPDRLYAYYMTSFGKRVNSAVEELSIAFADKEEAKYLNVKEGQALLLINRTSYDADNEAFEFRRSKINPHKYKYKVTID